MDNSNYSKYEELGKDILKNGRLKINRTGVNTIGVIGREMRFNLSEGEFPLITTKKVFTRGIFEELKWFIKGETNIKTLTDKGVHIWDSWATEEGECGPIYGEIWRRFPVGIPTDVLRQTVEAAVATNSDIADAVLGLASNPKYKPIDQLQGILNDLKTRPFSRRHIVSAWAPSVLPDETVSPKQNAANGRQALAACHTFFQLFVEEMSYEEAYNYRNMNYHNLHSAIVSDLHEIDKTLKMSTSDDKISCDVINKLKEKRDSLYSLWEEVDKEWDLFIRMVTPGYEGTMLPRRRLSLELYQRSADYPIGIPYNIASYAALLQLIAMKLDMMPGDFIHSIGDTHVYVNQVELFKEQVERGPKKFPVLLIRDPGSSDNWDDIDNCKFDVFGYNPHPKIDYPPPAV